MRNMSVTYRVVGRYMRGKELTGYEFISSDNKSLQLNKERTIYMIGKGLIENMRIQTVNDEIIIRGKGINLNNLPVYDEAKQSFRQNEASQMAANSGVKNNESKMSQFSITKRIMHKNNCIGYVVSDYTGCTKRFQRDQVIKLGLDKRLSNAVVQKYTDSKDGSVKLCLRGIGINLRDLPIIIIDEQGKLIDPKASKTDIILRAARMKHSGVVTYIPSRAVRHFEVGDYIVVKPDGKLGIVKGTEFITSYKLDTEHSMATCDYFLDNMSNYTVELFGNTAIQLSAENVKSWPMAKYI